MFWMEERALGAAYNMEGGFNDVAIRLAPGASEQDVAAALDQLLEPYGSFGTVPQRLQTFIVVSEQTSCETSRQPACTSRRSFSWWRAFLLNVSLNRIVAIQREQIAALKAVGYTNVELGLHYAGFSLVISVVGAVAAVGIGKWLGVGMIEMYNRSSISRRSSTTSRRCLSCAPWESERSRAWPAP
jgi:putative ABC transport system permease protein